MCEWYRPCYRGPRVYNNGCYGGLCNGGYPGYDPYVGYGAYGAYGYGYGAYNNPYGLNGGYGPIVVQQNPIVLTTPGPPIIATTVAPSVAPYVATTATPLVAAGAVAPTAIVTGVPPGTVRTTTITT